MKRKLILIQVLLSLVLSLLCCFALLGCGGAEPPVPEVKNVTITAADGVSYGKVGALHQVTYTVPEGCKVATSVQIGDDVATVEDYSYIDGGYIFYTAGEYTVTVYASKGGMLGHASAKITVHDGEATVSDVRISAAAGETPGKVGALHVLTYTADADCEIGVEIKKGEALAEDVSFNSTFGTIIFGSAGRYTVTVTATIGTVSNSAKAEIEIVAADAPVVSLTLDKNEVREDETVTLGRTIVYAIGDSVEEESVSALYRVNASGTFNEAEEDTYTLIGDRFTPHLAGEWKVVCKAQGRGGASAEAEATFKCTPAEVTLSLQTIVRRRIQTNQETDLNYLVQGAADKYAVSFDTHGNSDVTAEAGDGYSVRVTAAKVDYFTVTVVYTHKIDSTIKKTVDIDVYSVESLTYAPAWGEDPFDGMPSDVLTSMGHLLYFNAKSCGGVQRELTSRDAKYEVIEHNVTATSGGTGVEILNAASDENYPYVIVTNFDNNVAKGDFTLKMTVTDPYTGYSAVAAKKFTVLPTGNSNETAAKFIQNYVKEHSYFYNMGSMNLENLSSDCRQNMVLTKTGTIMQRSNPSWPLKDSNGTENSDFAKMDFATAAANCRLEFKFSLLAPNPSSGEVWLGIGMRTVTQNGWAGFFDLHIVDGRLDITKGLNPIKEEYLTDASQKPLAVNGATLYVRIDRRINGSLAEYTVYAKTEESAPYKQFYRCTAQTSNSGGNVGAPVAQYQFTHRNAGGCYAVENVTVTNYDA